MNARRTGLVAWISFFLLLVPLAIGGEGDATPAKGTVRADDGLSIVYDVRGKGDTALVFLHGWCGDRTWWKHQLDAFAGDYRVVANAEYQMPEEQSKKFLESFEADFKGTMRMGIQGLLPEQVDPELLKGIVTKVEAQDPKMALALFRDFPRLDTKALLKEAKVPVRCINAAPALKFATPTAVDVNKKYADFNAVIMEGVGHFPMLEQPAEFNQKLREVLKEFGPKK